MLPPHEVPTQGRRRGRSRNAPADRTEVTQGSASPRGGDVWPRSHKAAAAAPAVMATTWNSSQQDANRLPIKEGET